MSAFNQRANFYSACVYLAQSNLCLMVSNGNSSRHIWLTMCRYLSISSYSSMAALCTDFKDFAMEHFDLSKSSSSMKRPGSRLRKHVLP